MKDSIINVLFDNWCNNNEYEPEVNEAMDKAMLNPTEDNVSQLASVIEANAFKAGAKACLDMIHCLFMENSENKQEDIQK